MSVINLALSNSALAMEVMDDMFKSTMKKCNIMASVRKMAETLEAYVVSALIPNPTHTASSDVVDATSPANVPSIATLDATASSVAVVVDASINAPVSDFVVATSGIVGKTNARAFYILMRIVYMRSLMVSFVF